jgi:hypothetical protein
MQKKTFPDFVSPMMAQSAKGPFGSPDWIFETKYHGWHDGACKRFDRDDRSVSLF